MVAAGGRLVAPEEGQSVRCAVMQPTYFPWGGYFNLIASVEAFVFLDDVQYERGTWHNRNRVLLQGQPHWLAVPVMRGHLGEALNQVHVDEKLPWRKKHIALLRQVYGRHPFAEDVIPTCEHLIGDRNPGTLAQLNERIIAAFCVRLDITTPLLRSSDLGIGGQRSERLARMCEHLGCDEYLSPPGASEYLAADGFVEKTKVRLRINDFQPEEYKQYGEPGFVSHMSIIDIVANLGWDDASAYVRCGSVKSRESMGEA